MSNPIRQAIDGSLSSLKVTDRDVQDIMERIRQDEQPRVRKLKLRYAIVLAVLLALLTAGGTAAMILSPREIISDEVLPMAEESETGLWLTEEQVRKVLALAEENGMELPERTRDRMEEALGKYGGYWTERLIEDLMTARYGAVNEWPQEEYDWFVQLIDEMETAYAEGRERGPVEGELSREEAIARAEELVWGVYEGVPLNDAEQYEIQADFFDGLSVGYYPGYYWRVDFVRKNVAIPGIELEISADGQQMYSFISRDGADMAARADQIYGAFQDVYGVMETWSQETLRAFVESLKRAEAGGVRIESDYYRFMMETEYPDVPPEAITASRAGDIAMETLRSSLAGAAVIRRAVYIGDEPHPVWKVTVLEDRDAEGYTDFWNYYVEVDSVTGEVKCVDESASRFGYRYMYALHSTYRTTIPDSPSEAYPSVSAKQAQMSAVACLQRRYGEARDLNDPELFEITVKEDIGWQYTSNIQWLVTFDAREMGAVGYWAYVDGFGKVLDAGVDNGAITKGRSLDSIRFHHDVVIGIYDPDNPSFEAFMEEVRSFADQDDPIVRLLCRTRYAEAGGEHSLEWAEQAVCEALGVKPMILDAAGRYTGAALIDAGEQGLVWKFAISTEKGEMLVEMRDDTCELLSAVRVENLCDPWYAAILLESDMEAAGIAPEPYVPPVDDSGLAVDEGCVRGMRLNHIYARFCGLYGPDPLRWSQAQRRSFQNAVSQSSSLNVDIGVACMQDTRYPDVPAEAVSREEAARAGAEAMALSDYEVIGAALIADAPNAVWKVCYHTPDGWLYAEVDCLSGEVKTVAERSEMNYWFQDLVLERIIREHEGTFESTSVG